MATRRVVATRLRLVLGSATDLARVTSAYRPVRQPAGRADFTYWLNKPRFPGQPGRLGERDFSCEASASSVSAQL
jgi:hypothetical protein